MVLWVAFALAGAGWFSALLLYRQRQGLQAILQEGARGYEILRAQYLSLEKARAGLEGQVGEMKKREDATRSALAQMSSRAYQAETDLDLKTKDFERRLRNVELQRDHMLAQKEHFDEARGALSETIETLKAENARLSAELKEAGAKVAQKLRQENVELRAKLTDQDRDLRLAKSRPDINPREFDTLRRKVGQYELLYNGMKSQRDMVDERNRNWEAALQRLAVWVLKDSPLATPDDPILQRGIGPIVGEALNRIGAGLVEGDARTEHEAEREALANAEH